MKVPVIVTETLFGTGFVSNSTVSLRNLRESSLLGFREIYSARPQFSHGSLRLLAARIHRSRLK